jgi:hypothetical protein
MRRSTEVRLRHLPSTRLLSMRIHHVAVSKAVGAFRDTCTVYCVTNAGARVNPLRSAIGHGRGDGFGWLFAWRLIYG